MLTTVVVTIFGPDRPGLVEAVARRVREHGGNWLESRLLRLGGHFAGIVRVEVDADARERLLEALRSAAIPGLNVSVQTTGESSTPAVASGGVSAALEIVGHDRPGIVRELTAVLAARQVNVEELATERTSAPMSGEPIFQARAKISLPAGLDVPVLRAELEKIAGDLMVDLRFPAG